MASHEEASETISVSQELLDELKEHVEGCLGGRIHNLRIRFKGHGLVLEGQVQTYYAKQLAQQRVMEASDLPILANEISVA
jgi:hypothetical protein